MNARDDQGPWNEVLDELRRMRMENLRREEELWGAVDEIRGAMEGDGVSADSDGHTLDPREYRHVKRRFRRFVATHLPSGGRVAVVSRGDEGLLDLPGCEAIHFPQAPEGGYAGFYPRDGTAAVAHLEWVRAGGTEYLLFPGTATWWMDEFPLLAAHIEARYTRVAEEDGAGILFRLSREEAGPGTWTDQLRTLLDAWDEAGSAPSLLDWNTGLDLDGRLPGRSVFSPPDPGPELPYLDGTVDVVAVAGDSPAMLAEARRVCRRTVVRVLEGGRADGSAEPEAAAHLHLEHRGGSPPSLPAASIVIPTYNGIPHLVPCLRALDDTLPPDFDGEVIAVDDCSDQATAARLRELERRYGWLEVLRNEENQGFLATCNRGAGAAGGDYVIFLNDDTVPLTGWLEALLHTFRTHEDAGAVGGRLLFPDGRLQEAGGVVFHDARAANFGRNDDEPDASLYSYVRPVDYCSAALLATPRSLFDEIGGFDTRYRPIYYEDTDYCFAVRAAGRRVYYQPESTVVHVEGATSGTDETSGLKRYQVRNREAFRAKWRDELLHQGSPPGSYDARTWHRLAAPRR